MLSPFVESISDIPTREAILRIVEYINLLPFSSGNWQFIEIPLKIGDNSIKHSLGFKPKDMLILSQTGQSTLIVKYNLFTNKDVVINSTQTTTLRALVGTYEV